MLREDETLGTRAHRDSGVKIVLTPEARRAIDHHSMWETAQDQCETGGALFGIATLDEVLVTRATGPGPAAVRKSHELQVDRSVSKKWELDDHICRLGLWHTHGRTKASASASASRRRSGASRRNASTRWAMAEVARRLGADAA
jgi:hypothetical protein